MEKVTVNKDAGQILVQVALLVGVLFAFLALALDVGHLYAQRRRMQNAADAGALAGARELCYGDEANAKSAATEYAVDRNGATWASVRMSDSVTVTVFASETVKTFFAGVIGIDTAGVGAEAAAVCGKVTSLCNVWPIAYSLESWEAYTCGQHILLWEDGRADCDEYTCTCDVNSEEALPVVDARTWIDFSAVMADGHEDPCDGPGCGTDELKYRVVGENNQGETCRSYLELPGCAAGAAGNFGAAVSAWKKAVQAVGEAKYIPLYDPTKTGCQLDYVPGDNCNQVRLWLVDVACMEIRGSCRLCNEKNCNGPHVIDAVILCDDERCANECGTTSGEKPEEGDIKAVSLVK